jgi:hypothetical protein
LKGIEELFIDISDRQLFNTPKHFAVMPHFRLLPRSRRGTSPFWVITDVSEQSRTDGLTQNVGEKLSLLAT